LTEEACVLFKQLDPRYRTLLSRGQQGEAVIIEARDDRLQSRALLGWNVAIRVKLADGNVKGFDRYIEARSAEVLIKPGIILPIRFDLKQPIRVEIDTNALLATQAAWQAGRAADVDAVQQAEARLQPLGTPED
jgi:hypothetical protein